MSSHTHGMGGGFINNGSFEIMLKRRVNTDDGRGVDEPLTDLSISKSKFRLFIGSIKESIEPRHTLSYELNYPSNILSSKLLKEQTTFKMLNLLNETFPKNLHLLSFDLINNESMIVRLQNLNQIDEKNQSIIF